MKVGFSKTKSFVPEWNKNRALPDGEQIIATLTVMQVTEVFDVLDAIQAAGIKEGEAITLDAMRVLIREAGIYLPKYATLANAEDFTLPDVIALPPFLGLATELLLKLVEFSQPGVGDTKNS